MSSAQQILTKLKKTQEAHQSAQKVQKHLDQLQVKMDKADRELKELADLLAEQYEDFEQLTSMSMKSLFYKVLGSKEEQLEKEKQEYLAASLKYDETKKAIDLMLFERKVLEEKLEKLSGVEGRLKQLLKEREQALIRENSAKGRQLLALLEQIEDLRYARREVSEAIDAGRKAEQLLHEMLGLLKRARNWGNWDMMGKKRMASYLKQSTIDKARERAHHARYLLSVFEDELRDVFRDVRRMDFSLQIGDFNRFTDIFFDNLISDWIIQRKIHNALSTVSSVRDRVVRLLGNLDRRFIQFDQQLQELEAERKQLVMS
ncbi:MAG: hypothetical protein AAFP19_01250 [Bacteroidota bacterium]